MSSVVISGNTSGAITLSAPDVSGTNTATLPAATGTVMVSGNMPAFSAYKGTAQTVTTATFTKVTLNTEEFDTNNNFDSTTNYRFTPTVAGYYQINGEIAFTSTVSVSRALIIIYKNGSAYKYGCDLNATTAFSSIRNMVSSLIYFNGSTDYVELYGYVEGAGTLSYSGTTTVDNYFNGSMVRAS